MSVLGIIFILLVVADTALRDEEGLRAWFDVASWALWAVFAFEFVLRLVIAPSAWSYLRRHWWQVIFLVVPFLRFLRVAGRLARLRPGRLVRVVSSALRGMKTATRKLSNRLAWLSAVTAIVVLASSQLLFEFGDFDSYGRALHDAALATITGEGIESPSLVADVLELILAVYSVVVFASLAAMLGAYMLEGGQEQHSREQRQQ
ncbi:MAG: ion transporter [Actinobacteria bacterium]|nr:ion transporter [Actinomycetota bacterium]